MKLLKFLLFRLSYSAASSFETLVGNRRRKCIPVTHQVKEAVERLCTSEGMSQWFNCSMLTCSEVAILQNGGGPFLLDNVLNSDKANELWVELYGIAESQWGNVLEQSEGTGCGGETFGFSHIPPNRSTASLLARMAANVGHRDTEQLVDLPALPCHLELSPQIGIVKSFNMVMRHPAVVSFFSVLSGAALVAGSKGDEFTAMWHRPGDFTSPSTDRTILYLDDDDDDDDVERGEDYSENLRHPHSEQSAFRRLGVVLELTKDWRVDSSRGNHEPLLYNELYNHTADVTQIMSEMKLAPTVSSSAVISWRRALSERASQAAIIRAASEKFGLGGEFVFSVPFLASTPAFNRLVLFAPSERSENYVAPIRPAPIGMNPKRLSMKGFYYAASRLEARAFHNANAVWDGAPLLRWGPRSGSNYDFGEESAGFPVMLDEWEQGFAVHEGHLDDVVRIEIAKEEVYQVEQQFEINYTVAIATDQIGDEYRIGRREKRVCEQVLRVLTISEVHDQQGAFTNRNNPTLPFNCAAHVETFFRRKAASLHHAGLQTDYRRQEDSGSRPAMVVNHLRRDEEMESLLHEICPRSVNRFFRHWTAERPKEVLNEYAEKQMSSGEVEKPRCKYLSTIGAACLYHPEFMTTNCADSCSVL